jgi:hypothetical protein
MALQPFLLGFGSVLSLFVSQDSLDGDQPLARALAYTQYNTDIIYARTHTHTHTYTQRQPCLEWDSNPRPQHSSRQTTCPLRSATIATLAEETTPFNLDKRSHRSHTNDICYDRALFNRFTADVRSSSCPKSTVHVLDQAVSGQSSYVAYKTSFIHTNMTTRAAMVYLSTITDQFTQT